MKIKYLSHACLYCEAGDDRIVMDPWLGAPAYLNQWHIHPQPLDDKPLKEATVILISHGHEDHLHAATLARCNKQAHVYYPYQPFPGIQAFIQGELGFKTFVEAIGNRPYLLPGGARVTLYPVGHDCIFVIEDDRRVLVNVNDALHSCSVDMIITICNAIRRKFPRIDYVFCGFGGASFFPNCFHHPSKDDFKIAWLREVYFARNFCLISQCLQPAVTVPFAADFRLRHDSLLWINNTRFERSRMPVLYKALFADSESGTEVKALLPGQRFSEDGGVSGDFESGPDFEFVSELPISRAFDNVVEDYRGLIERNLSVYPLPSEALPFAIKVTHFDRSAWIVVGKSDSGPKVTVEQRPPQQKIVTAAVGADSVEHLLKCEWNSDVIVIGYAMEFWFDKSLPITDQLVHALGDLVTQYPKIKHTMFKTPLRFVRWAVNNHQVRFIVTRKLRISQATAPFRDATLAEWLDTKSDILARQLGIPASFASPPVSSESDSLQSKTI